MPEQLAPLPALALAADALRSFCAVALRAVGGAARPRPDAAAALVPAVAPQRALQPPEGLLVGLLECARAAVCHLLEHQGTLPAGSLGLISVLYVLHTRPQGYILKQVRPDPGRGRSPPSALSHVCPCCGLARRCA